MHEPDLQAPPHSTLLVVPGASPHLPAMDQVGGKGHHLHRLVAAGAPVPPWFTLTTTAYEAALGPEVLEQIRGHLALLDGAVPGQVALVSALVGAMLRELELPLEVREPLLRAYRELGEDACVAVRSSAVDEDGAGHSFAGQHDTFLNVQGEAALLRAVRGAWASAFSERSLNYRLQSGRSLDAVRMAVVVQPLVTGEVSGVMFTANPLTGRREDTVVSATYGLGEGLVSGELDADTWTLDRSANTLTATLATKTHALHSAGDGGTEQVPVPVAAQNAPCLSPEQLWELAHHGSRLADALGGPQDIEWTLAGGRFAFLQARPITALPPVASGRTRLFDNSNVSENYSGVTTPLTFSFARWAYEITYRQLGETLGFYPQDIQRAAPLLQNMIALIRGRVYYNLGHWYELMAYFPGYSVLRRYFALSIGLRSEAGAPATARHDGGWSLLRPLSRMLGNYLAWDRITQGFAAEFGKLHADYGARPYATMPLDELTDTYVALETDLIACWRAPLINDFFATLLYGLLKQLIVKWQLDEHGSLHNDLLCGEGGIISTEPTRFLLDLARSAWTDEALRTVLMTTPADRVIRELEARGTHPDFLASIRTYQDRYGYRCIGELRLESVPLTEDPSFLFVTLANYLRAAERDGPAVLDFATIEAREQGIRRAAETRVAGHLQGRPLQHAFFRSVLSQTRKAVKNRENMRFNRTQVFGLVRNIFREAGVRLAADGRLDHPRDVFYLELGEVVGWVQGRATCTDLAALARLRRAEFASYEAAAPEDRFETRGPVHQHNTFRGDGPAAAPSGPVLRGTSCCPGVVKGIARVVRSAADMHLDGEILVAERTDPGWTPLFPSASALLIERGSMLSHSAIVAREMGLPTIVGIPGLLDRVVDGQYLEVDAREGLVYLERQP